VRDRLVLHHWERAADRAYRQCVEVGVRDAALNTAGDGPPDAG
jgi:hypothetical protein